MNNTIKLYAFVGMPGAGKSEAAAYLNSKGLPIIRFGDETDIELKNRGWERNPKNEKIVREETRAQEGMAAYAMRVTRRIQKLESTVSAIILDGLYSWSEYKYLKHEFQHLFIIAIFASPQIRYTRLANRAVRPLTQEEAQQRDYAEIENIEKGGPIAMADYLLINESAREAFLDELEQLYQKLSHQDE